MKIERPTRINRILAGTLIAAAVAVAGSTALAADEHQHHHPAPATAGTPNADVKRSVVEIKLPATPLVRQDGAATNLSKELDGGKPVILAFIYTSCTTVCPVTSQIIARTQNLLGKDLDKARLVSVSIDPEYDTPARLLAYSKLYAAKPQWQHYTGTLKNSVAVQKAFSAYRGDKMNHVPLIFINGGKNNSWVKLEGFPSAEQVVKEYQEQIGG
ncbi:MAG: SCO family protein [Comamonadaceae bacterium]